MNTFYTSHWRRFLKNFNFEFKMLFLSSLTLTLLFLSVGEASSSEDCWKQFLRSIDAKETTTFEAAAKHLETSKNWSVKLLLASVSIEKDGRKISGQIEWLPDGGRYQISTGSEFLSISPEESQKLVSTASREFATVRYIKKVRDSGRRIQITWQSGRPIHFSDSSLNLSCEQQPNSSDRKPLCYCGEAKQ